MNGDISNRIPITAQNDEFDRLANTLNEMLGKVEELIDEIRVATESMAHDLRSPLTRLRSQLEQISNDGGSSLEIESAISETDRILKNLNALLSIARLETGLNQDQTEDVSVATLLEDVCDLYGPLAEEKGMHFEQSIKLKKDHIVKMNAQLMAQALSNLIENAFFYAGEGKKIIVSAEETENSIALIIADNGPGISTENREKALERFSRLSPERSQGGMGLGLYLVSVIMKIHKFKLSLEDNEPGLRAKIIISWEGK